MFLGLRPSRIQIRNVIICTYPDPSISKERLRKTLISTVFLVFEDCCKCNCSKYSNKQRKLFVGISKAIDKKHDPDSKSSVRIKGSGSVSSRIRNTGTRALGQSLHVQHGTGEGGGGVGEE